MFRNPFSSTTIGDENPIRTLGNYSRPSHEGYRNTIKLPEGKNVVPLRSDTIRLVQNGCSFHGLWSEDPIQHLKDFLKLVDSLDLDGEIPSIDEPKPQPQPLPNCLSLDVSLGEERGPEPPIKPHSPDSFRMKEVDSLTINTPPSPHVSIFYPKDNMFDDDWGLESKKVSPLGKELSLFDMPNKVERGRILEAYHLEPILQQQILETYGSFSSQVLPDMFDVEKEGYPGVCVVIVYRTDKRVNVENSSRREDWIRVRNRSSHAGSVQHYSQVQKAQQGLMTEAIVLQEIRSGIIVAMPVDCSGKTPFSRE
ncbi:hypothetical protein Tco_1263850 [Tanacetum coccineum]